MPRSAVGNDVDRQPQQKRDKPGTEQARDAPPAAAAAAAVSFQSPVHNAYNGKDMCIDIPGMDAAITLQQLTDGPNIGR